MTDPTAPTLPAGEPAPVAGSAPAAAAASRQLPRPLRRLLWSLLPANLSIFLIWGAVPTILLAVQIDDIDSANAEANLAFVLAVGAFCAMVAQPVAGVVSDRTRSRFGRRAPWMVAGALIGGLGLIGMSLGNTIVHILIAWIVVQIAYNFAQGPLSAIMPDRVPTTLRGTFSAIMGLGLMLGVIAGQGIGSFFEQSPAAGYVLFAGIAVVVLTLFIVLNPDASNRDEPKPPFNALAFIKGFWISPRRHPDFAWAFAGRFLINLGYNLAMGFQLYILMNYIGMPRDEAAGLIPLLGLTGAVLLILTTLISGPMSDRVGCRRVFVIVSALILALGLAVPIVLPNVLGMFVFAAIVGFGFGIFQAVDTALITEVLPSQQDYAKDLGVINIAATLPQTVGPALAGTIVVALGYVWLFPFAIVFALLAALSVIPIKSVR